MSFVKFASALALVGVMAASAASAADLTVTIKHVRSAEGVISVAIYNTADGFLEDNAEVRAIDVKAMVGETPVTFKDLQPGTYAVAAFHDENASGEFDTTFIGLPEEGYGFSNGASASFGPPAFEEAAVTVDGSATTELPLNY
jgi:uncharacterized protein (DUF2141 family)